MAPQWGAHNLNSWGGSIQPPIPSHTIDLQWWHCYQSNAQMLPFSMAKIYLMVQTDATGHKYWKNTASVSLLQSKYAHTNIFIVTYYMDDILHHKWRDCINMHMFRDTLHCPAVGANRISVCWDRSFETSVSSTNVPIEPADYGATNSDNCLPESDTT